MLLRTRLTGLHAGHPAVCFAPDAPMPAGPTPTPVNTPLPVANTPAPTPIPNGTGGANPPTPGAPWYAGLDEPVRNLMEAKALGEPAAAAKAYYEANKYITSQTDIVVPKDDAPPEMVATYRKKLGIPDDPNGYQFDYGKDAQGQPLAADPLMEQFARENFHKIGLPPKQAQELINAWQGELLPKMVAAQTEARTAEDTASVAALKQQWGPQFDANVAAGQQVVKALNLPADQAAKINDAVGSPAMLALFAELGKRMGGEGAFLTPTGGTSGNNDPSSMTPVAAKAEVDRLTGDKDFQEAYRSAGHPGHKQAVDRMQHLYARAYSTK